MKIQAMLKNHFCYTLLFLTLFTTCDFPSKGKKQDPVNQWQRPEKLFILKPQQTALVIIDMQNFSCTLKKGASLPHIQEVIKQINKLVDFCHIMRIPVIWVRHNITMDSTGTDAGLYPLFHDLQHINSTCNRSNGTEISPAMHFNPSIDHVVYKNRYSAFLSDPQELRKKLDNLKRKQLIIAGVAANVCVESTVRDAMQLDYEVVLVSDGVTATDDILLESMLMNTRHFFGDVRTTEEIMKELR